MKKISILAIVLFLALTGCSKNEPLEIIEENRNSEFDLNLKSGTGYTMEVGVTYDFSPFSTSAQRQAFKNSFRQYYDQYFIIYTIEVISDPCPDRDFEIWTVNTQEYFNNLHLANNPPQSPLASGSIEKGGKGTSGGNASGDGTFDKNGWLNTIRNGTSCTDFVHADDETFTN